PTLGEDSGLEVDALEGAPGVFSARWSLLHGVEGGQREGGIDAANNALLLERLANVPDEARTARYRCVVAYIETATAKPELVEATCEGRILTAPRGNGGFGYDPLVLLTQPGATFAGAGLPSKRPWSHGGRPSPS